VHFLLPPVAEFFYAVGQLVLPGGRLGRALARFFLRQALFFNPRHDRAVGYLDYLRGVQRMQWGDPDEGLRLLRRAMRALPGDPAVALDAGVAMTIAGEHEAAVTTLSRLLAGHQRRMSQEPQLWFALTWSLLRLGRYSRALDAAGQAAQAGAASPGVRLTAALARVGAGAAPETEVIQGLVRRQPRLLANLLEFTEQMAEAGKPAVAELLLEALPPDVRPRGLRLIALSSVNRDSLAAARWALDRLVATAGRTAEVLILESELRLHEGDLPAALRAAQEAVARAPGKDAAAEEQLGEVLLLSGREEEAYGHFVEAIAAGSPSALAGGVVALRLLEQGQAQEARQVFRLARQGAELGVAYAHAATALVLLDTGHLAEAVSLAEQADDAFRALPSWAAQPPVVRTLTATLARAARQCLTAAQQAADEDLIRRSERLLRRLTSPPPE
jgi:tetratricopeptide (TPR) repeat protein